MQNEISVGTINNADRREGATDATVFEAAVTLCHMRVSGATNARVAPARRVHPPAGSRRNRQFPLLKAEDQLPRPAQVRRSGLEMSPIAAAKIRKQRFFRLIAMQLRRRIYRNDSSQHAKTWPIG